MPTTLTELIAAVRRRACIEQSPYISDSEQSITDAEITDYLNEGGAELHGYLTESNEDYSLTSSAHTIASGASSLDLPDDFYRFRGLDRREGDGYCTLQPFDLVERNDFQSPFYYTTITVNPIGAYYSLRSSDIQIEPSGSAPGNYRLWYVPVFTNLVDGDDEINHPQNWNNYLVLYAALQCRVKENIGDANELMNQVERMRSRILSESGRRGQPKTAKRVRTAYRNRRGR